MKFLKGIYDKEQRKEFKQLSKRWIKEGTIFNDQLNGFLDALYSKSDGPEEPRETREDVAPEVYGHAVVLNENGEHEKLRELLPLAYEPFIPYLDSVKRSVNQVIVLKDGKIVVRADGHIRYDNGSVYILEDDKITEPDGVMAVGISENKDFIAKITEDAIHVHRNWDDEPIWTGKYPKGYDKATTDITVADFEEDGLIVLTADVFNDGKRVLLSTTNGAFIISEETDSKCVFPTQEMLTEMIENFYEEYEESEEFEFSANYFHAKLSPDNTKIATGFQSSDHYILEADGNDFKVTATISPSSEYPHTVGFHDKLDHVALASCHMYNSNVIGMDLSHLPIEADGSEDSKFDMIGPGLWVFAILPYKDGYLMGANNGYIWYRSAKNLEEKTSYIFIGGTIGAMDYSADKKYLVVSNHQGFVLKIDLEALECDKSLITNMNVEATNRWVIWRGPDNNAVNLIW